MNKKHLKAYRKTLWSKPPKFILTQAMLTAALKELYDMHFEDEKSGIEYRLILNYKLKASARLLKRLEELEAVGKEQAKKLMQRLVYNYNPLLEILNKQTEWLGRYTPVPLEYK